jgi:16S rRNA (uracil1498-N3)-methyltransferase
MSENETAIRLFVETPLAAGVSVGLSRDQAHYLKSVMRLEAGAGLSLFNGSDGEWRGRVDGLGKGWASVALEAQTRTQALEPDLWLLFAPIKRARIDFVAQKSTELGVSALVPVFTRRTAVERVNTERLRANAVEAAEQCERLSVPAVMEPEPLEKRLARWPAERHILLCDETGGEPVGHALAEFKRRSPAPVPWAVLVGPEGGFEPAELDRMRKLPIVTAVGLGPRALRADTAALAALACWQARLGDWHGVRRKP